MPIKGTVTGQHGPPDCTKPDRPESEGTIKVVAANGDELHLEHTMLSVLVFGEPGPPLGFTFEGSWEAVGGTGRFAQAEGSGVLGGVGDSLTGRRPLVLPTVS